MISGRVDPDCFKDFPQLIQVLGDEDIEKTDTVHIMPIPTTQDLENAKKAYLDVHTSFTLMTNPIRTGGRGG